MKRLALVRKAAAAIRHQAFALRGADRRAEIGLVRGAALALAAFRCVQRNHVIAFLQAFHVGTDVDDDAGALVAEDRREDAFRVGAGQRVLVGMADAGRLDLDQHFARSEEHTSELQSLMRISYAVFCLKKKKKRTGY